MRILESMRTGAVDVESGLMYRSRLGVNAMQGDLN